VDFLSVVYPGQFTKSLLEHGALHFVVAAEALAVDQSPQVKDAPAPGSRRMLTIPGLAITMRVETEKAAAFKRVLRIV